MTITEDTVDTLDIAGTDEAHDIVSGNDSTEESDAEYTPENEHTPKVKKPAYMTAPVVLPKDDSLQEPEEVDYEAQRRRNILENQRLMLELGLNPIALTKLHNPVAGLDHASNRASGVSYMARKHKRRPKPSYHPVQTRSSKRIRNEEPQAYDVDIDELERGIQKDQARRERRGRGDSDDDEAHNESALPPAQLGSYSKSLWKGRRQTTGFLVEAEIPCASGSLTLGSIATTIWDIGKIYTGKDNRLKYWSGKGCIFRHPYPIGFRAEKFHFRDRYTMHIKEGKDGPIFIVESASGQIFEGPSPTQPWTKACLASYSKGTRISGPLFFGFSDPITQKMIEDLEGYQRYEDVVAEVKAEEARAQLEAAEDESDNPEKEGSSTEVEVKVEVQVDC